MRPIIYIYNAIMHPFVREDGTWRTKHGEQHENSREGNGKKLSFSAVRAIASLFPTISSPIKSRYGEREDDSTG